MSAPKICPECGEPFVRVVVNSHDVEYWHDLVPTSGSSGPVDTSTSICRAAKAARKRQKFSDLSRRQRALVDQDFVDAGWQEDGGSG